MLLTMENNRFRVEADLFGAELRSILDKGTGREYLWQGPFQKWPPCRTSVLFPACGPLWGGGVSGRSPEQVLPPGGFFGGMSHKLVCRDDSLICFRLESTPETEALYPYRFAVKTTYALKENRISSRFKVLNYGKATMYFRCGFLTAFRLPAAPKECRAALEQEEALTILETDRDGLLTQGTRMWEPPGGVIPLEGGTLDQGLILKEANTRYIQFGAAGEEDRVRVYLRGAPYAYLRTSPAEGEEGLLCLGVWHGLPDHAGAPAGWAEKEAVVALGSMEEFYAHQTIEIGEA